MRLKHSSEELKQWQALPLRNVIDWLNEHGGLHIGY